MAVSTCHVRSVSLPSQSHPLIANVEDQLKRFSVTQATSTSACRNLSGLKELYENVNDLIHLPLTQQALSHEQSEMLGEVLDGSLRLLDVCGTTTDVFFQMRESLQQLQSSLRRRNGGESGLATDVGAYMVSREELNKVICKCFKNLKGMEKSRTSAVLEKESDLLEVISLLKEAEKVSLSVFQPLLSFASLTKLRSSGWSVVSKLVQSKRVTSEEEADSNQVKKIDAELLLLKSSKDIKLVEVQRVLERLEALESTIKEAEEELECVFRRLLKTRISLLNILNH